MCIYIHAHTHTNTHSPTHTHTHPRAHSNLCAAHVWVTSHVWMSHVTHMPRHTHLQLLRHWEGLTLNLRALIYESCHTSQGPQQFMCGSLARVAWLMPFTAIYLVSPARPPLSLPASPPFPSPHFLALLILRGSYLFWLIFRMSLPPVLLSAFATIITWFLSAFRPLHHCARIRVPLNSHRSSTHMHTHTHSLLTTYRHAI